MASFSCLGIYLKIIELMTNNVFFMNPGLKILIMEEIEMNLTLGATADPSLPEAEKVTELKGLMVAGGSLPSTILPSVTRKPLSYLDILTRVKLKVIPF